ncbi:SCO2400 family protein [Streptomyces sp. NPDC001858]
MDYCNPCRRHLNGALACPGCGTAAEQLRASPREPARTWEEPAPTPEPERVDGVEGVEGESPDAEPQGRAARRREQGRGGRRAPAGTAAASDASRRDRKATAHRRRRKRTILVTVGFVLAAGGLSLAELGVDAPGFSSTPDPAAAGGESAEVDGSTGEPSATAQPLDDRTDTGAGTASPSPDPSGSPSASSSASASPDDGTEATRTPDKEAQSAPLPGSSGSTTPSDPDPTPTSGTTPGSSPEPSPSETCTRFLWWCS